VTDEEFISLLDERGSNIAGWPAHLREGARVVLAHSPQARVALKVMADVESLLTHTPALALDTATLAARATRQNQARRHVLGPIVRKVSFAALGAMALAAGILVGMTPPSDTAIIGSVRMALNGGGSDVQ
jgi:hypothetical protein